MYVHCHYCSWEQDDFWSKHYNPALQLWQDVCWLWKPRMLPTDNGWVFSWFWLVRNGYWRLSAPFKQKWWTLASWKKAKAANKGHYPPCPKCGEHALDTD